MKIGVGFTVPQRSNLPGQSGGSEAAPYEFKFEVASTTAGNEVGITVLPRATSAINGFTIVWQDGTSQTFTSAQTNLKSPTTQAGVISINKEGETNFCDDFAVVSEKQLVTKVISWGKNPWNRLQNAFKDCTNLTEIGTTGLLTDGVNGSTFNSSFEGCTSLTAIDMTNWDLSSGVGASMSRIAKGCINLEQVDLPSNKKIKFKSVSDEAFMNSGTSTTNGCIFNMQGLDSSTTTSAGGYGNVEWFRGCKISPSSNFSNWVFNSSLAWNMSFTFYLAEMTGTNSTLDLSGWSTLKATNFSGMFRGFNSNGATPKPDSNFTIKLSNLNLSYATNLSLMFGFASNVSNIRNIIGLSTLPAMVSASTITSYFIAHCPFLKLTDSDNLSDAFMNSLNSTTGSNMFSAIGKNLTFGDYGKAPNLAGVNFAAATTMASAFRDSKFSNALDFSNVIFPTAAVSYSTFCYFLEASDTDAHMVIDRPTFKPSGLVFGFGSTKISKITIGDSVDLSEVTTFQYLFLTAGTASRTVEVTLPTTADYGGTTLSTSFNSMFSSLKGPLGGTQVLSTCVGDTFIRRLHASTLNNNAQLINLFNTKLTGSPSVVSSNVTDLETAGWTITDNSTDAVMPFVYTTPITKGVDQTPTGSFTGGTFSSSDAGNIPVNAATGEIDATNAGNVTIRYTITATGCYNEQALVVEAPLAQVNNVYSMEFSSLSNDVVNTGNTAPFNAVSNKFSVSLWCKSPNSFAGSGTLVDSRLSYASPNGMAIEFVSNTMNFRKTGSTVTKSIADWGLNNTNWNHVVYAYDLTLAGDKIFVYINGSLLSSTPQAATSQPASTADFTIGDGLRGSFNGMIDEVGTFNTALTQEQVTAIYNATETGKTADLNDLTIPPVKWYRMGD